MPRKLIQENGRGRSAGRDLDSSTITADLRRLMARKLTTPKQTTNGEAVAQAGAGEAVAAQQYQGATR